IVRTGPEIGRVSGVGLFELALSFEVPVAAVDALIFLPGLTPFRPAPLVAGLVGTRRISRLPGAGRGNRPVGVHRQELVARDHAVAVLVHALERRGGSGPLAPGDASV